jgi:beta-barrel assembly-enhancing protease
MPSVVLTGRWTGNISSDRYRGCKQILMRLTKLFDLPRKFSKRLLRITIALVTAASILLAAPLASQAVPWFEILIRGAQIIQVSNISDAQEVQLGASIDRELSQSVRISSNAQLTNYIDRIGQQLARTSARPGIRYTFKVVDDNNINAFATMGGYVYINTGTIRAADNEAQLASVIGHEIGHITGKHGVQNLKQKAIAQGISAVAGVQQDQIVQIGVELALNRPRSRKDEYDADNRGLNNIIKAGYAPSAMPEFMKKLVTSNAPPEILSTHPGAAERATRLQQSIPASYRTRTQGLDPSSYKQNLQRFSATF